MDWNPLAPPDQRGRTIVVTGSTAGIGYFAAEQLAAAGAHVVLASRSPGKLAAARDAIRAQVEGAAVDTVTLDLASPDSVADAADVLAALPRLDGLLLNGGAMDRSAAPTAWGVPTLLATHVVANVALIARLLPTLTRSGTTDRASRIVHTSSGFVDRGRLDVSDARATPRGWVAAYTKAKTVTEVFAFELERRLREAGAPVASLVSRPGVGVDARTPERVGVHDATTPRQRNPFTPWAQGKDTAAWSAVRATTDTAAGGGELYAPLGALRGLPARKAPSPRTAAPDAQLADSVWRQLEELARVDLSAALAVPAAE
jgi:NAD(P)-dependent dehydrogenase (short-subunit alcohol dehydrogenase family)